MRQVLVRGDRLMLSVDPGGTTGWLLFRPSAEIQPWGGYGIEPIAWGEERDQQAFCDMVWKMSTARLKSERIDGIVCERWTPRDGVRTWEPEPVEITGFCRWKMGNDPTRFFLQGVSEAKAFGTDTKVHPYVRSWDPPFNIGRGGEGHARIALMHALLWTNVRWMPNAEERAA